VTQCPGMAATCAPARCPVTSATTTSTVRRQGQDRSGLRSRLDERESTHKDRLHAGSGDRLATRPRGTAPDHPRLELLRHRSLYAYLQWEPDDALHEPVTAERVAAAWRAIRPLTDWLDDHVGPSESPRR
jgi:uncharacterized protein (DUF2461 family)